MSGFESSSEVERPESGSRRQQNDVDTGVEDALVTVKTDELAFRRDADFAFQVRFFAESFEREIDPFLEDICHRVKLDVVVCCQGLFGGSGFPVRRCR